MPAIAQENIRNQPGCSLKRARQRHQPNLTRVKAAFLLQSLLSELASKRCGYPQCRHSLRGAFNPDPDGLQTTEHADFFTRRQDHAVASMGARPPRCPKWHPILCLGSRVRSFSANTCGLTTLRHKLPGLFPPLIPKGSKTHTQFPIPSPILSEEFNFLMI